MTFLENRTCETVKDFQELDKFLEEEEKRDYNESMSSGGNGHAKDKLGPGGKAWRGDERERKDRERKDMEKRRTYDHDARRITCLTSWAQMLKWYDLSNKDLYVDVLKSGGTQPMDLFKKHKEVLFSRVDDDKTRVDKYNLDFVTIANKDRDKPVDN